MTNTERRNNLFAGLFETSTYSWMMEHEEQWKWENDHLIAVGNPNDIPDWVLRDFQIWNEDIERIGRM